MSTDMWMLPMLLAVRFSAAAEASVLSSADTGDTAVVKAVQSLPPLCWVPPCQDPEKTGLGSGHTGFSVQAQDTWPCTACWNQLPSALPRVGVEASSQGQEQAGEQTWTKGAGVAPVPSKCGSLVSPWVEVRGGWLSLGL